MISPQQEKYSRQVAKKLNLSFDVLEDPGNETAARFGLVFSLPEDLKELYKKFGIDLPRFNGNDAWELPMPGRFIVNPRGVILDAEVHPDYTKRPEPEEILPVLNNL